MLEIQFSVSIRIVHKSPGVINRIINLVIIIGSYVTCVILITAFSPLVGFIAGCILIPAFLIGAWSMPLMRVRSLVYRAATSDTTATVQETVKAIKLIKAHRSEEREQEKFETDSVIAMNASFRVRMMIVIVTIVMFTFACACLLAGRISFGEVGKRGARHFLTRISLDDRHQPGYLEFSGF